MGSRARGWDAGLEPAGTQAGFRDQVHWCTPAKLIPGSSCGPEGGHVSVPVTAVQCGQPPLEALV